VPLPIDVVPVKAVGDELALLPLRFQLFVNFTTCDAHRSIAQDLPHQNKKNLVSHIY
jgi:hypothetical protein